MSPFIQKLKSRRIWLAIAVSVIIFAGCQPSGPSGGTGSGGAGSSGGTGGGPTSLAQSTLPPDAGSDCQSGPQATTTAMVNGWFESGTASLNGAVKPANSVEFSTIPNCNFYQWTEQMFLWLTSPATGRYGKEGLVMNSPVFFDVSLPDDSGHRKFLPHVEGRVRAFNVRTAQKGAHDLPVILEKNTLRLLEVLPPVLSPAGKQLIQDKNGNEIEIDKIQLDQNNKLQLLDKNQKEIAQPKAMMVSAKIKSRNHIGTLLLDQNVDRSALVQKFTIDKRIFLLGLDGVLHEAEQGQADGGVLMAQNGSLVYYSLIVNNVFVLYRTMLGATIAPGTKFPVDQTGLNAISVFAAAHGRSPIIDSQALCIEMKCSWVEAAGLPDSQNFIRMTAEVPTYDKSNPNDWKPNGTKTVMLAMVGMHVVGSTKGHPELLWGTFEHVSNDPAAAYTYTKQGGGTGIVPQNTEGSWVFCASGAAAPFNTQTMMMQLDAANHETGHIVPFTTGVPMGPTNILRTMPFGMPGSNPVNAEVISTNNVVRSVLAAGDLRRNYIQTGTTWTIGGASPSGSNQVGTNKMANTTMETFAQGSNCFGCHHTNTTAVSHVFNGTAPLF